MSGEQTERRIQEPGGNGSGAGRIARQPDVAARYLRALGEDSEEAYSSSSSSSSKSPAGATAPRVCTRAWRRMLLWTLKLLPQPSNGHVYAVKTSAQRRQRHRHDVSAQFGEIEAVTRSPLTSLARVSVEVNLCSGREGECEALNNGQTRADVGARGRLGQSRAPSDCSGG